MMSRAHWAYGSARGNPTVQATVTLSNGVSALEIVPSGGKVPGKRGGIRS